MQKQEEPPSTTVTAEGTLGEMFKGFALVCALPITGFTAHLIYLWLS